MRELHILRGRTRKSPYREYMGRGNHDCLNMLAGLAIKTAVLRRFSLNQVDLADQTFLHFFTSGHFSVE